METGIPKYFFGIRVRTSFGARRATYT